GTSSTGAMSKTLTGLTPGTTYYVRAYATNNTTATGYGVEVQFTTQNLPVAPTVTTLTYTNITTTTVDLTGNVSSDGGASLTERGFVYATTPNPTTSNSKATDGTSSTGAMSKTLTGLTPGTTYYVRAYATNNTTATGYGVEVQFRTQNLPVAPTVTTLTYTNITTTTVDLTGNVSSDGGAALTERGFVYATTPNPTTSNSKATDGTSSTGAMSKTLTGLTPGTTYYVRAYATNNTTATGYGVEVQFTTQNLPVAPTVTTLTYTNITTTTVDLTGNVSSDGGAGLTERGFVYATTPNPTISDSKVPDGTSTGAMSKTLTGLTPGTTYYVRAYATNTVGTGYGVEVQFTTQNIPPVAPTVTTLTHTNITTTTADVTGNVSSDGGAGLTERGFVYATTQNPTISDSKVSDGTSTGAMSKTLTGLTPGTTYYVRAYATNSAGTSYGTEIQFITIPLSSNAGLTSLLLTDVVLNTTFNSETVAYTASVGNRITQTDVTATLNGEAAYAVLSVFDANGNIVGSPATLSNNQKSGVIALNVGINTLRLEIFAQNGTTTGTYTFAILRVQQQNNSGSSGGSSSNSTPPSQIPSNLIVDITNPNSGVKEVNAKITQLIGPQLNLSGKLLTADGTALNITEFPVNANGAFTLPNVGPGEYKLLLSVIAPTGEKLAGRVAKLTIDSNRNAKLEADLIDPYGIITDSVTGKPVDGVKATLHWSDTELNKSKGRKAGDLVILPELPDFAPNKNHDPQISVNGGQYGWMVFPDGDYYILGEKDGYEQFDSRKDNRDVKHGDDSYVRGGNIHVGVSIVEYSFQIKPKIKDSGEHMLYIEGFPDGLFHPENSITRAELATILSRILPVTASTYSAPTFTDVNSSHWAAKAIIRAGEQHWLTGYPNGSFAPEKSVTRAEFAQMLSNIKNLNSTQNSSFNDITGHWGLPAISAAEKLGYVSGYPDGTFRPDQPITRAESVKVFNKLLDRQPLKVDVSPKWGDVPTTYWGYDAIMEASSSHKFDKYENGYEVWKN
uniref:S-layer homology domain-containing protein n=2 Tax=Paenibacillus periandrae TaxID=1761741 RepID=UPI001F09B246